MVKIILFGDSITAGYYEEEGITDQLTKRVAHCFKRDQVINAGIPGDTTEDGLKRVTEHVLKYEPEIVTIFFGANDVATYRQVRLKKYLRNIKELMTVIGKKKMIILSAPYTNQQVRKFDRPLSRIGKYVNALEILAEEEEVPFINVMQAMLDSEEPNAWLQKDGLHFSEHGYECLAELVNEEIQVKKERIEQ